VYAPPKYRHLLPEAPGTVSDRLICFADLAPTVLNLAGIKPPDHMHGRPFLGPDVPAPPAYVWGARDRIDETLETSRWITDGRYHLIRAYRRFIPFDQQTLTSWYNSNGELCREIRGLKRDGKLTEDQLLFWSDFRPGTALFDSETDPWNMRNLADDPAHADRVETMAGMLERFLTEERDLGFWPEPDLAEAEVEAAARDLARRPGRYPIARILDTAKLEDMDTLLERLNDAHAGVRYWAVAGLAALGENVRAAGDKLMPLLSDDSVSVRIETARLVVSLGESPAALDVLAAELENPNEWAACRAARALELLGPRAASKADAMRKALSARAVGGWANVPRGSRPANYGLTFSLVTALERLEPETTC
jgi:hypothetical protein